MDTIMGRDPSAAIDQADCLDFMRRLPDACVDLILTDPPYFRVKGEAWDRQWESPAAFLTWLGTVADEWKRVLKPTGSLYCFASSKMAAQVEVMLSARFRVLSHIVWDKVNAPGFDGWKQKCSKESLREWYDYTERIIFAEQDDNSLGNLLRSAREQAGLSAKDLAEKIGAYGKVNHGGSVSNWEKGLNTPTLEQFTDLRKWLKFPAGFNADAYRRFFEAPADFTDMWRLDTVRPYKGKHPCEKPAALLERILTASSRPGDIVLDCFAGGGSTAVTSLKLGRSFIGCEIDPHWCATARERIKPVQS